MTDRPDPQPEDTEEAAEESAENKPHGLIQYPAPPGQTQYGGYQNRNK